MTFQEIVDFIDRLSREDRDRLFELIRQRKIEEREAEILYNFNFIEQAIISKIEERTQIILNNLIDKNIYRVKSLFIDPIASEYFKIIDKTWKQLIKKHGNPVIIYFISLEKLEDEDCLDYLCKYFIKFKESKINIEFWINPDFSVERLDFYY